jgi:hypothetical protein
VGFRVSCGLSNLLWAFEFFVGYRILCELSVFEQFTTAIG